MGFSSGGNDQTWFKDDLVFATDESKPEAIEYVHSIFTSGGRSKIINNNITLDTLLKFRLC